MSKDGVRELEEREGMLIDPDGFYGIIKDETAKTTQNLLKVTGLLGTPFKVVAIIPVTALQHHKNADQVSEERVHAIKIGDGVYDARYLAAICERIDTQNVEFYQVGKDNPLGLKIGLQKAVIAPIIIGADVETVAEREQVNAEKAMIPTLDKVMDDYFSGKRPGEAPKFSLRSYAKKK